MAESEEKVGDVKDVTCCLCLEQYQDPRVLACLHTYCRHCLESLVEHSKECTVSCPQCREKIEISVDEVEELKVNFMLKDLIENMLLDQENKVNISISCETCPTDHASGRCVDCSEFMCDFCIESHRRLFRTRQHTIISLQEATAKSTTSCKSHYCQHHKEEKLILLCDTCDKLICRDCVINGHRDHKYDFTSNIIDREKELIKDKIEEVKSKQADLSQALANVLNEKARIEVQRKSLTSEIDDFINAQISTLERMHTNLKDEVISDYENINKHLASQEDYLSISIENCNSCVKFAERVCQTGPGNKVEVLSLKKEVLSRLSNLANSTIQDVLFERMLNTFKIDEDFWRSLSKKAFLERKVTADPQQCIVSMGTGAEPGTVYSMFAQQRTNISVAVKDSKKKHYNAPVSVEACVQKTSPEPGEATPLSVIKQPYGTYGSTYIPHEDGDYKLSVTVNGEHVRGSPFKLRVRPKGDLVKMLEKPSDSLLLSEYEHVAFRFKLLQVEWLSNIGVAHDLRNGQQVWGCSPERKYVANKEKTSSITSWKDNDVFDVYLGREEQGVRMVICNKRTRERDVFEGIHFPVQLYSYGRWRPQFG
ncbi:predicted protein [Nematostella vectensis]|uniref:Uncharacterized protein n=1 Tax=Nematostella vectensis TaxID=45351 RepID=A7T699_NEMVE|nr:predicted protein [Nematostella vectensis]|eukprot:XP_001620606.1 hypothetical protein NEMVEDRAFT_v1g222927 [Nematostella vectensis]